MTITLTEAHANLPKWIAAISPGDELLITDDDRLVAKLVRPYSEQTSSPRKPGLCKGSIIYMAPDFDAPLDELREYME